MIEPLLGKVISDRYRLTDVLGQGGMGIVFKAEDLRLNDRLCAVKLLKGQTTDPNESKRFEAELQIISRLRSPHVVQVLDTGYFESNRLYIVMELLEGDPLSVVLKREKNLSIHRAIQITKGVLAGLSEAHEYGIVHRDLKPANIFITQSRAGDEITKVLDFGIAKDTNKSDASSLTSASMIIGTPKYMAPEQFMKQVTDIRTDIYAVGLLLYQMINGAPPFVGNSPLVPESLMTMPTEFRVGWLHINAQAEALTVPNQLWTLIDSMISKSPDQRPSSTQEIIERLNTCMTLINSGSGSFSSIQTPGMNSAPVEEISAPISYSAPQNNLDLLSQTVRVTPEELDDPSTTGIPVIGEHFQDDDQRTSSKLKGWHWGLLATLILSLGAGGLWYKGKMSPSSNLVTKTMKLCHHTFSITPKDGVKVSKINPKTKSKSSIGESMSGQINFQRPCGETWDVLLTKFTYHNAQVQLTGSKFKNNQNFQLKKKVAAKTEIPKTSETSSKKKQKKEATSSDKRSKRLRKHLKRKKLKPSRKRTPSKGKTSPPPQKDSKKTPPKTSAPKKSLSF
jgi:serine/threonine protein kinase